MTKPEMEPTVRSRVAAAVAGMLRWLTKPSPTTRPPGDTNDARAPGSDNSNSNEGAGRT